ncbi:hypothetical protein I7F13_15135 [Sinorhizobium meliloti]|uniref:hypothetical protein n=1 Tax=Rhizobium meliloti TaxID=382 RepID=UPI000FD35F41|nr:hypothetical protein [Sinorhizobium meliloti]MDE3823602.1 hypothetical protein [Sinorhizobium meliloti]QGJ79092.1 hypothetical protein C3L21_35330 [Sinorhizobium meliloti]RVI00586.1 hypothetical protein CN205_32385 [Sinorhizobium meliloti]RVI13340.1 hypothetical protein CN200_21970 [Sinorhizobium meliloti]RVK45464.1 hypothetical protein CN162_31390 [Sinorhizobium meliloti]
MFPSIKQAAHALAEAASIDPKKFAARVYFRFGKGWPIAEAFDLEPHEDGRTTERSRQPAAAGVLLATARSKDHRDRLKARQASIKKGSLCLIRENRAYSLRSINSSTQRFAKIHSNPSAQADLADRKSALRGRGAGAHEESGSTPHL